MYLVELEAGREELYQSVDALASAIRRGEVGAQSRIFHRASSSWISITVHPEYRKAAARQVNEPLPPMARTQWTFFGLEPRGREIQETVPTTSSGSEAAVEPMDRPSGLRGILRRAFRGIGPSAKPSESPAD